MSLLSGNGVERGSMAGLDHYSPPLSTPRSATMDRIGSLAPRRTTQFGLDRHSADLQDLSRVFCRVGIAIVLSLQYATRSGGVNTLQVVSVAFAVEESGWLQTSTSWILSRVKLVASGSDLRVFKKYPVRAAEGPHAGSSAESPASAGT